MVSSSDEEIITLKEIFGHQSDEESLRIANTIDTELLTFFNQEVVQNEEMNILPVMRKGLNLFHPYLENIKGMRTIVSIKPLNHQEHFSMDLRFISANYFNHGNILLTDAITTGSEIRKILTYSPLKFKILGGIKKVCGYMALKSALDELEKEYPGIKFSFLKVIEDLDEYNEEHKKIIYVYQKRMAPIDGEHGYFIIDSNPALSFTEIKDIIQESFRQRYGSCFELIDNDLGVETKHNFTVYFYPPEEVLYNLFNIRLYNGDIIEKLSIRFKYSSDDSKLRVMALSMPNLDKETLPQYLRRKIVGSCKRSFSKRNCKINLILRLFISFNRNAQCSKCVDANISRTVLKDIYFLISESDLLKKS